MAILQVNVRPASLRPQGRARRRARAGESTANATQSESSRSHPDASSHGEASPQKSDSVPVPDKSVWQRITWKLMPATPVGRALVSATERLRDAGIAFDELPNHALRLHSPRPVDQIPGFFDGLFSVQDAGAQWAARWLAAQPGERVLDAWKVAGLDADEIAKLHEQGIV